jgi:SAM-dependent methyltransferase
VGCGHARKLAKLSGEFDIIGIDYGPNIEYCRNTYSFGVWLEADFETPLPLPLPKSVLDGSIVICSDVIEHMVDPMALLALLKELLTHAAAVVLSTPDRARTYGQSHFGPSPNRAHTREWTAEELGRLLKHAGFEVASLTHTRSNDVQPELATVLAVLVNRAHVGVQATMTPVPADVPEAPDGSERISAGPIVGRRGPAIDAGVNGLDEARQAVERAPESPDAWLALAIAQESHGCAEGFEQALGEALRLDRGHVPSLRYLATLQLRQGDPREAAWMFDELLDDGAVDVDIVEGSVLAHWRSGDVKAAAARLLMHG